MKHIFKYLHTVISFALLGYLSRSIYSGNIGETYNDTMDRVRWLSAIVLVFVLLFLVYYQSVPYKKRMIVLGGVVMIIVSHAVYTDTTMFFGSDLSKIYGTITVFLALFGVLSHKTQAIKGQYSKKAEIIEV